MVHIAFNCIGTVLFMIAMSIIKGMGGFPTLWESIVNSGGIANFQTIFNLVTAVVLVPFTGLLVKLSCLIVKDESEKEDKYPELAVLDRKLMISPAVALAEAERAMASMARIAKENLSRSLEQFTAYDTKKTEEINECEDRLDSFADDADNFLIELSRGLENERDKRQLNMLMQCIPDIERVGDYATNFDEMALKMHESSQSFSEGAKKELSILGKAVQEILDLTVTALENDSEHAARRIEPLEEVIDDIVLMLRDRHTQRLCDGVCSIASGLHFMDVLTYLERASDQCSSIAMMMLSKHNDEILQNHHHYLRALHETNDQSYLQEQERRREQFVAPLEKIAM